jgi:parallel beta-helix repeat protein
MNKFQFICFILVSVLLYPGFSCSIPYNQIKHSSTDTVYLYVSTQGNDSWSGEHPYNRGNNGPFASINRSILEINKIQKEGRKKPIVIEIVKGEYFVDSTILISSMKGISVIFRSYRNETVSISGGKKILKLESLLDQYRKKINPNFLQYLLQFDIEQIGLSDFGSIEPRGFPRPEYPSPVEIYVDGEPLQLARWPNSGWTYIKNVPEGRYGGQFSYEDKHIENWGMEKNIWLHGFWARDWADSYLQVEKIDIPGRTIVSKEPHGTYGYVKGQRFYALNILSELDTAGEWYFNNGDGKLVFWPTQNNDSMSIHCSILATPILEIAHSEDVTIRNLTFEIARGTGIRITNSYNISLSGVTVRNVGNRGIVIKGGENVSLSGSNIYNTGEGGIYVSGGDRISLRPGNHKILNTEIHHTNRWVITYSPGIFVEGVGNIIRNNFLHDIPHMAIRFKGNNHLIELNEIKDIGFETGDAGAIYTGKDWSMRGTILRNNYIHNISSRYPRGMIGIYLDDFACGSLIEGNIFRNVQRGIVIGGGRNNIITKNIFQECHKSAVRIEFRESTAENAGDDLKKRLNNVPYQEKTWSRKYKGLRTILEEDPMAPKDNSITRNIIYGKFLEINDKAMGIQIIKDNDIAQSPVVDSTGQVVLDSKKLKQKGINISVEKIGLTVKEKNSIN